MVNGLQGRKIVIVDLDGTLIQGNSFHEFIKINFKYARFSIKLKLIYLSLLRIFRIIKHSQLKFKILKIISLDERIKKDFKNKINEMKNEKVWDLLDKFYKTGAEIWLATAAPDIYIPIIWNGKFIATKSYNNEKMIECKGINKVKEIKNKLNKKDVVIAIFTDHYDDIPLIRLCSGTSFLVKPSKKSIRKIRENNLPVELLI